MSFINAIIVSAIVSVGVMAITTFWSGCVFCVCVSLSSISASLSLALSLSRSTVFTFDLGLMLFLSVLAS